MTKPGRARAALHATHDGDLELALTITSTTPGALAEDLLDAAGQLAKHFTSTVADRYVVDALNATRAADEARR